MSNRQTSGSAQNGGSALAILKAKVVFLLSTLSEETYARNERELTALVEANGAEANVHTIRRLIVSAQAALAAPPSAPIPQPNPAPYLALRLLITFTQRLIRDPLLTHRFREAVLAGMNDTSSGSASTDAFRTLGENLSAFSDRAGFNGLERFVLGLEMLRALILPSQAASQATPSARSALALHQKSKESGLSALALIRESWSHALEGIANGQSRGVLGPVGLSRLLDRVASDWQIDTEKGELGIWEEGSRGVPLFDLEQKRSFMRAIWTRVSPEPATQLAMHSLENMEQVFASTSSTISILHRLIPDPSCCFPELVHAIILRHGRLPNPPSSPNSEARIAELFLELLNLAAHASDNIGIKLDHFSRVVAEHFPPNVTWSTIVLQVFDNDRRALPETWALKLLANFLVSCPSAVQALWSQWNYPRQQLLLLERLAFLPQEIASIGSFVDRQEVISAADVASANSTVRGLAQAVQGTVWNSYDLIHTLIRLMHQESLAPAVADIFERAIKINPESILVGLVMAEKPWTPLHASICARLLSSFLAGSPGHQLVFFRIWHLDRGFLLAAIRDFYAESELNIGRIVDISQDLHILPEILELRPFRLALDAAALASRREFLELARWLSTTINRYGAPFVKEALAFVGSKVRYELRRNELDPPPEATTLPLVAGAVAIFMKALRINHELFNAEDVESFKEVRTLSLQLHPRLLNFAPGGDQEPGMAVAAFPADVEAEVDATFKRMYETDLAIDEVVRVLQRSRDSGDPKRIEFYQCMLHGLMDEMRFVATYPPQELMLTAYLFGSLIQHQVVDHIPLGIAVRYVLDALKHPPSSASYKFGINALARFQTRLQEWPQLASAILAIPHITAANPEIATYARAVLAEPGSAEAVALQNGAIGPRPESPPPPAFTSIKGVIEGPDVVQLPDDDTSDKILFIINNLSPSNLHTKVSDMNEKLKEDNFRWLANYLVLQRVCIEPNNHSLYLDFLTSLARPLLSKHVLQESYLKSASLLNSEKTVQSSTERTLLKNLGAWIGAITLARNLPIKHDNIAFKELLVEGFDSGRLIAAIPFVCKILEQGSKSTVFQPPNPWLMGIIRLLVELYQFAELKLNLKFEIEVLCKSLNLDLKHIEPTQILRNRPEKKEASTLDTGVVSTSVQEREGASLARPSSGNQSVVLTGQAGFTVGLQEIITAALQVLPTYINFNPGLHILANNPGLKRAILAALDRAIRDIIGPVVERSVTIAGISTQNLIMKDFATEGSEETLRKSAHLMAQNLAGSLALVTCKEPLRISIVANLRTFFLQNGYSEHNLPEPAINMLTNDNLDLACSVVERVAMDKAISDVDESLGAAYLARRKHRERSNAPFWDPTTNAASHYATALPEALRLKTNGLQAQQLQVYEDFARLRAPVAQLELPNRTDTLAAPEEAIRAGPDAVGPGGALMLTVQQAVDKFTHIVSELDAALPTETATSLGQLPSNSDVVVVLAQLPLLAARSLHTDETALACAQKVVQLLYRSSNELGREVYATLLHSLCKLSDKVVREVIAWLIYADDERKYNVAVTVVLIKQRIVPLSEYEAQLAKFVLRDFRPSTVEFAATFASAALESEPPLASREQLAHLLDALVQAVRANKASPAVSQFLETLRLGPAGIASSRAEAEAQEIKEQLAVFFVQWVRIFQQSAAIEASFIEYVVQLQDHGILNGEDLSSRFFRTCTEVSIDTYIKAKANGGNLHTGIFQPVDALGALIAFMLKYHGDGSSHKGVGEAKAFYLTKVLSIVVLVLAQAHEELGVHFAVAQKPFFRLFSSILSNLHQVEAHLGAAYSKVMVSMSYSINMLQPTYFPGFAFSWVTLISHRLLMPKLLRDREGQAAFLRLLTSLLRFLEPHLRQGPVPEMYRSLYEATVKIFLVLLHDHPEFLSAFHITLCDAIPASCLQLQNIVLSAFPADVKLADSLAVDAYKNGDFRRTPVILTDYISPLSHTPRIYQAVEAILSGEQAPATIGAVKSSLRANSDGPYNRKLVSSLVMTLITSGIAALAKTTATFDNKSLSVQLYFALLEELDPEGRYLLVGAVTNQLRYPNTHTEWASQLILHTFESDQVDDLNKEITLRAILERICCQRPHPFGVVLTQVELLRRFKIEDEAFLKRAELKPLLGLLANMRTKSN